MFFLYILYNNCTVIMDFDQVLLLYLLFGVLVIDISKIILLLSIIFLTLILYRDVHYFFEQLYLGT